MNFDLRVVFVVGCILNGLMEHSSTEGIAFYLEIRLKNALQCYVCENCIEGTELEAMQICGELPFETTVSPSATETTSRRPTTAVTTAAPGNANRTSTTRRRSTTTTTRRTTTTNDDDSDDFSDYDDSDEARRNLDLTLKQNLSPKQLQPVCYMVKYRVNNTEVSSLGCTSMIRDNNILTCKSLELDYAEMLDCQLCLKNGCNKLYFNGGDDYYGLDGYNTGIKPLIGIMNICLCLFIVKLIQ